MDERVMLFIDGSNFYYAIKEIKRRYPDIHIDPFDFFKFSKVLARGRKLIRTYYYTAQRPETDSPDRIAAQRRYFDHIKQTPYCTLRLGHLASRYGILVEKGVDVLLTVDMMRLARLNSYDTAILVSGDGDFTAAVSDIKELGKQVELAFFPFSQANSLRQECDRYTEITTGMLQLCLYKPNIEVLAQARA